MSNSIRNGFKSFLKLEKSLSSNSIDAYLRDIDKLYKYSKSFKSPKTPNNFKLKELQNFIHWVADLGVSPTSQARIVSGIKGYYKLSLIHI